MPTIQRIDPNKHRYEKQKEYAMLSEKKANFIEGLYNTNRWRAMRQAQLREQPLCEICYGEGRITAATEVHHKNFISNGSNPDEMMEIAFDPDNLQSLCKKCHMKLHGVHHAEEWKKNH